MLSPSVSLYSSDDERFDRASCSSIDSDPKLPSSSRSNPSPPLWITNGDSDSDEYSPVCSETDPAEFDVAEENENRNTPNETMDEFDDFNVLSVCKYHLKVDREQF